MTDALCLNCGDIKFGALCPCPRCMHGSTGNTQLDIVFSDHHYHVKTLRELGRVIEVLRDAARRGGVENVDAVVSWAFIQYMSDHHPSILRADLPAEFVDRAAALLGSVELPPVTLRPGRIGPPDAEGGGVDAKGAGGARKAWWQFWRRPSG